jgi:hypothetical protein
MVNHTSAIPIGHLSYLTLCLTFITYAYYSKVQKVFAQVCAKRLKSAIKYCMLPCSKHRSARTWLVHNGPLYLLNIINRAVDG